MSEYIEVECENGAEPGTIVFTTNVQLSEDEGERYSSVAEMEEGSPIAQALAFVPGILQVRIEGRGMIVWYDLAIPLHAIIADVSAVIRDFFL